MRLFATAVFIVLGATLASTAQDKQLKINFQGVVGDRVFDCRDTYEGIGTTGSKMTVSDFRFFVHNIRLIDKNGRETHLSLTDDGKFQTERVALLDFENGLGTCANGTTETNLTIRGIAANGKYVGLKFNIGVPQELNHLDPTKQPSPLNITRMMWSWQSGYKFVRIDTKTAGRPNGYVLHLGSAGCKTNEAGKTTCANANRPEFSFAKFDPTRDIIKVDLKTLYSGANVDINQEKTAAGCMSSPDDSDCKPVFTSLGLAFGDAKPASQSFMRVDKMPKASAGLKR